MNTTTTNKLNIDDPNYPTNRIKHLEFIQNVITRHNTNSFMIKGWTITITAALFALAGTIKEPFVALISIFPICVFWYLDSIFLTNERCYRSLYECVINDYKLTKKNKELSAKYRVENHINEKEVDENDIIFEGSLFSMDFSKFTVIEKNTLSSVFKSQTIKNFYRSLLIISIIVFGILLAFNKFKVNKSQDVNVSLSKDTLYIKSISPVSNIINKTCIPDTISIKIKKQ